MGRDRNVRGDGVMTLDRSRAVEESREDTDLNATVNDLRALGKADGLLVVSLGVAIDDGTGNELVTTLSV